MAATAITSLQSLAVSIVGSRNLTLAQFAALALCATNAHMVAAMMRAAMAESGFDALTGSGGLRRARIAAASAGGFMLASVLLAAQFAVASISWDLLLPGAALAAATAANEVGRVRLISLGQLSRSAGAEALRLVAVVAVLVAVAPGSAATIMWVAAAGAIVPVLASLPGGQAPKVPISLRQPVTAGFDVLIQRGAGQLVTVVVFAGASAEVAGAIGAARLVFAPVTTLYSASSSLALVDSSVMVARLRRLLVAMHSVGLAYTGVIVATQILFAGPSIVLGQDRDVLDARLLLPIGLFVSVGAAAPLMSTSLRRVGLSQLSLRARVGSSVLLVVGVSLVVLLADPPTAVAVGWAYAAAGAAGAGLWWTNLATFSHRTVAHA